MRSQENKGTIKLKWEYDIISITRLSIGNETILLSLLSQERLIIIGSYRS